MWVTAKLTTIGSVALGWDTSGLPVAEWVCWDRLWDTSPPVVAKEAKAWPLVSALAEQVSGGDKACAQNHIPPNTVKGTLVVSAWKDLANPV